MSEVGEGSVVPSEDIKQAVEPGADNEGEAELPLIDSIAQLEEIIEIEGGLGNLFLRWSPDIEADRQPGATSRNLTFGYEEGGISVHNLNPYPENGYGLDEGYSKADHFVQDPKLAKSGPRKYYLLRGEKVVKGDGKLKQGTDGESILKPESILPIAQISREATREAYIRRLGHDRLRGLKPKYLSQPGERMGELREELAVGESRSDDAKRWTQQALDGIDAYLAKSQSQAKAA